MKCYKCGFDLSEKSFCTACGADVYLYKKIMQISNLYYNDGLDKANVRDLSGAIASLRQSIKFNKNNVEARNLLGLVYFEMGETVAALSEWVISNNLRPKKNIADDYIAIVQSTPSRLDMMNQTIKKFNQALAYCMADSNDLAVIQLKKVLSMNPNMIKAHQLLALLYIHNEEWEKARRELTRSNRIDSNNTMTLRYLKEVNSILELQDVPGTNKKKKNLANDVVVYQSGNETIIQPVEVREPIIRSAIINILIGLAFGIAVTSFLILPGVVQNTKTKYVNEIKSVSEKSDEKTATITDLEQKLEALMSENEDLKSKVGDFSKEGGILQSYDSLIQATTLYMKDSSDLSAIQAPMLAIDPNYIQTQASSAFNDLYQHMMESVGPQIADNLYETGYTAEKQNDYTTAIEFLEKAWFFDDSDPEILYQLAQSYRLNENIEKAKETYQKLISLFPESQQAQKAQEYLQE